MIIRSSKYVRTNIKTIEHHLRTQWLKLLILLYFITFQASQLPHNALPSETYPPISFFLSYIVNEGENSKTIEVLENAKEILKYPTLNL